MGAVLSPLFALVYSMLTKGSTSLKLSATAISNDFDSAVLTGTFCCYRYCENVNMAYTKKTESDSNIIYNVINVTILINLCVI